MFYFTLIICLILFFWLIRTLFSSQIRLNETKQRQNRILYIEKMLGCNIGTEYIMLKNEERFHPDQPIDVWLLFTEVSFNEILNHVKVSKYDKIISNSERIIISNPLAESEENRFIEYIELKIKTKELVYKFTLY